MNISRQHAKIVYSKDIGEEPDIPCTPLGLRIALEAEALYKPSDVLAGQWELHVMGKNGVTLHGVLLTPEHPPHPLKSQDMIQIAEKQFHFLLPKNPQW